MGMLELENAILPVDGRFVTKKMRFETVACGHCGGVIAVLLEGCSRTYQSKHTCGRCNNSVCRYCAEQMHRNQGACNPLMAKIEFCLKKGWWKDDVPWRREGIS